VDDCNLSNITPDKQYQLWAQIDGQMVDLGVFEHNDQLQRLKTTQKAEAFVITIEPRGGSPVYDPSAAVVKGRA